MNRARYIAMQAQEALTDTVKQATGQDHRSHARSTAFCLAGFIAASCSFTCLALLILEHSCHILPILGPVLLVEGLKGGEQE